MLSRMLLDADGESVRKAMLSLTSTMDPEALSSLGENLYREIYGNHFTEWTLADAVRHMENEDGTTGPKWTVEQTDAYLPRTDRFNRYDWNYAMNMVYSDYYGAVPNGIDSYVALARKFICDKDAPEGKAYRYYQAMD